MPSYFIKIKILNPKSEILNNTKYQNPNASEFRIPKLGIWKKKHIWTLGSYLKVLDFEHLNFVLV
jgi:hypothetical protein